ncbi:MAG: hypothetical protein NZ918_03030 [Aigarchaeota archaeon]|nr:hypothetical protein [Aigarchaeota archaeon]
MRHVFAVGVWVEPTRSVTASVAASSVGTSYSDLTVTLPSSFLTENYVVIRIYSPNSNSSNYYSISVRDYTSTLPDELGFRGSGLMEVYYTSLGYSQSQWRCVVARAVGLEAVKIFETTINLVRRVPAAAPQPKIDIAFSGGTLTAVFKYGAVEEYVERTSSGTFLDKVMPAGTLLFQLYVSNGSTTVTAINYTEQVYFDKNPVTPRDFYFSELYLLRVDLPANGQVRLNDHAAGDLYSATATTITFTDFRIPVRKIEVIAGTPTLYFIGVI